MLDDMIKHHTLYPDDEIRITFPLFGTDLVIPSTTFVRMLEELKMSCVICGAEGTTLCTDCLKTIINTPELINKIKELRPKKPVTIGEARAEAISCLKIQIERGREDPESSGSVAVSILCDFISDLGHDDIAKLYDEVARY